MSQSYTYTESTSFTITDAIKIAAKVATDLKRLQRFYGEPSDIEINAYEQEIVALLNAGYLKDVKYGYKRLGQFIEPTLIYTARDLSEVSANDDDPGRVLPGADTRNATFSSYLNYNAAWHILPFEEKDKFKKSLPFYRNGADEPGINGYLRDDRTYSAGGRALDRASVRSY